MPPGLTLNSLLGALAYGVVCLAAAALGGFAPGRRLSAIARRNWRIVAAIFALMVIWRLAQGEQRVQDSVRYWTRDHGFYDERQALQIPATIVVILLATAMMMALSRVRHARRSAFGLGASAALALFAAVRAASLHDVDELLYRAIGVVHVNYLIDMGLTGLVGLLALLDWHASRHVHWRKRSGQHPPPPGD